jgi:hypothetical protein
MPSPLLALARRSLAKPQPAPRGRLAKEGEAATVSDLPRALWRSPTPAAGAQPAAAGCNLAEKADAATFRGAAATAVLGARGGLSRLVRACVALGVAALLCCAAALSVALVVGGPPRLAAALQGSRLQPKPLSPLRRPAASPPASAALLVAGEWVPSPFRTALALGHDGALRVLQVTTCHDSFIVGTGHLPAHAPAEMTLFLTLCLRTFRISSRPLSLAW